MCQSVVYELPRVFSKRCRTLEKFQQFCIRYEFSSIFLKSNAHFEIYDNASPCTELHWLLVVKLPDFHTLLRRVEDISMPYIKNLTSSPESALWSTLHSHGASMVL